MDNGQIEKLKQQWEAERKRDACCPNCGRCPTCGRRDALPWAPRYPAPVWWVAPQQPPWYGPWWGTAPTFDHLYRPGTINATNTVAQATWTLGTAS